MKKLTYSDITDIQIIDVRPQHAFQAGHAMGSLNLTPKNFKKYAADFLSHDQGIVFLVGNESQAELEELNTLAVEMGYTNISGYFAIDDIPEKAIQQTNTITAADFLKKEGDYILLDVRNPGEITRPAPEKNLITIPLEDLAGNSHSLDTNKEIYTLCGSGNRGTTAASYLASQGFQPTVIEGGMKAG